MLDWKAMYKTAYEVSKICRKQMANMAAHPLFSG